MKRITLVTWLGNGNYGTSLQSFALHKKLQELGYNVSFLKEYSKNFSFKDKIKNFLDLLGIQVNNVKYIILFKRFSLKEKKLNKFIKSNYNLKSVYNLKQKDRLIKYTDVFLTGSDQIWNTINNFNKVFFLDFAENKKRIAYASSMGIYDFPEEHKKEVKILLSKFTHIGVRERTAVLSISNLLNRNDIQQVLDPTFLIDANEWSDICREAKFEFEIPPKYILCYLIGNNAKYKEDLINVCNTLGIKNLIIIPSAENKNFEIDGAYIYKNAGPLEFVKLIKEASFICTDSFHAIAISINLQKDFVAFKRFNDTDKSSQNSRIYDILNQYKLNSRIYDNNNQWNTTINYKPITKLLDEDRRKSINFLINSIEN